MIRVAAVGDLHAGTDSVGLYRSGFECVDDHADLLLLAGDLTRVGTVEEIAVLVGELRDVTVPIVAVLGNHDHHAGQTDALTGELRDVGIHVLEGDLVELGVAGRTVAVAGTIGFGGGFVGACASAFGEPAMKAFVGRTVELASRLRSTLESARADVRIALTHYAPISETLRGEPLEIHPFLGSYLLGEAIDDANADLAVHGHAHKGVEKGVTAGGVAVRNTALPVIRRCFQVYDIPVGDVVQDERQDFSRKWVGSAEGWVRPRS